MYVPVAISVFKTFSTHEVRTCLSKFVASYREDTLQKNRVNFIQTSCKQRSKLSSIRDKESIETIQPGDCNRISPCLHCAPFVSFDTEAGLRLKRLARLQWSPCVYWGSHCDYWIICKYANRDSSLSSATLPHIRCRSLL